MAVFANVFLGMQLSLSAYLQVCFCITNDVVMSVSLMYEKAESSKPIPTKCVMKLTNRFRPDDTEAPKCEDGASHKLEVLRPDLFCESLADVLN